MSKPHNILDRFKSREITSSATHEWKNFSYPGDHGMNSVTDRWLHIKTREIVNDLTQILIFIRKLERFWFNHLEAWDQVRRLLLLLRWDTTEWQYMEIVQVIAKYLNGIRDFTSNQHIRWALSYKVLFEFTVAAMIREIEWLPASA